MFTAQRINMQKAQKLINEKSGLLVDVRDPVSFRDGTIAGAINLSLRQLSSLQRHPKTTPIVLFGKTDRDIAVDTAANYLIQFGFNNVYAISGTPLISK